MRFNNGRFSDWFRVLMYGMFVAEPLERLAPPVLEYWEDDAGIVFVDDDNIPFTVEPVGPSMYWTDNNYAIFIDDIGDPLGVEILPPYSYWDDDSLDTFIDDSYNIFTD